MIERCCELMSYFPPLNHMPASCSPFVYHEDKSTDPLSKLQYILASLWFFDWHHLYSTSFGSKECSQNPSNSYNDLEDLQKCVYACNIDIIAFWKYFIKSIRTRKEIKSWPIPLVIFFDLSTFANFGLLSSLIKCHLGTWLGKYE